MKRDQAAPKEGQIRDWGVSNNHYQLQSFASAFDFGHTRCCMNQILQLSIKTGQKKVIKEM